jgi:uncharacterized repeat protein (TIGR04042 family)
MPEITFRIRWPDGTEEDCYSPSTILREYFKAGETYPMPEFLTLSRDGLGAASDRVRALYGHPCSNATAQLARIEQIAGRFGATEAVTCLSIT